MYTHFIDIKDLHFCCCCCSLHAYRNVRNVAKSIFIKHTPWGTLFHPFPVLKKKSISRNKKSSKSQINCNRCFFFFPFAFLFVEIKGRFSHWTVCSSSTSATQTEQLNLKHMTKCKEGGYVWFSSSFLLNCDAKHLADLYHHQVYYFLLVRWLVVREFIIRIPFY